MSSSNPSREKLTKRVVDAAKPSSTRYVLWDSAIPGFGLRVAPVGTKTFVLRYRPGRLGRSSPKRFVTIGRYGPVTAENPRVRGAVSYGIDVPAVSPGLRSRRAGRIAAVSRRC